MTLYVYVIDVGVVKGKWSIQHVKLQMMLLYELQREQTLGLDHMDVNIVFNFTLDMQEEIINGDYY